MSVSICYPIPIWSTISKVKNTINIRAVYFGVMLKCYILLLMLGRYANTQKIHNYLNILRDFRTQSAILTSDVFFNERTRHGEINMKS